MDTLTIVREIIDLAAERDSLRGQLESAGNAIEAYQVDQRRLQSRISAQEALNDEQRAQLAEARTLYALVSDQRLTIERLRAELDAARSPAPSATTEPAIMTREQILSVAREALATGRKVRVAFAGESNPVLAGVLEIDDSNIPIRLKYTNHTGWQYLTCDGIDASVTIDSLELV